MKTIIFKFCKLIQKKRKKSKVKQLKKYNYNKIKNNLRNQNYKNNKIKKKQILNYKKIKNQKNQILLKTILQY